MTAIDKEGYLAYINLEFLIVNKGRYRRWHKTNPYSIYNINLYLKKNGVKTKTIEENYISESSNMKWSCNKCGEIFVAKLNKVLNDKKYYCNKCARKISDDKKKNNSEEVLESFIKVGLTMLEPYEGLHKNIKCINKEGYFVYTSYLTVRNNKTNFKIFDATNPFTIENIKHYIELNNINVELLSREYKTKKSNLEFMCKCGKVFATTWGSFRYQNKFRCDICSKNKSIGEIRVEEWLKKYKIKYISQYKTNKCRYKYPLSFDFAILDNSNKIKALIEVDGVQHFEPVEAFGGEKRFKTQLIKDEIKDNYAKTMNIKMIKIPYWEFKNNDYINKLIVLI